MPWYNKVLDFLAGLAHSMDIPSMVLLAMLLVGYYVLNKAQGSADFNMSNMLKNDNNKESMAALTGMGCFSIMSWQVVYDTIKNGQVDLQLALYYGALWSGVKVVEKIIDKWNGSVSMPGKPAAGG